MTIKKAKQVLQTEAKSILDMANKIGSSFEMLVNIICSSYGRVIVTGIGKSGLVGKKIVATLVSTGTNAIFLHPVEAVHGDLGIVSKNDVVIFISNSGETEELIQLIPVIKEFGCKTAGFVGKTKSSIAKSCDIIIDTRVKKEACPFNMTPTSSTIAQMAMGDALAIVLIHKKKFEQKDFIKSHPGGALGQRLSYKIKKIMFKASNSPIALIGTKMDVGIKTMDEFKLGALIIIDKQNKLKGIITDGDIRHCIANNNMNIDKLSVDMVMTKKPYSLKADSFLYEALNIMEKYQITILPIVDKNKIFVGLLHLHDILGKGSFSFNGKSQ